jgi:phage-related protein
VNTNIAKPQDGGFKFEWSWAGFIVGAVIGTVSGVATTAVNSVTMAIAHGDSRK